MGLRRPNFGTIAAGAEKFVPVQCVVGILEYSSFISSDERQLAASLDSNNSYLAQLLLAVKNRRKTIQLMQAANFTAVQQLPLARETQQGFGPLAILSIE